MESEQLVTYPYVKVRIACELCRRRQAWRLARLAAKFGAEIEMDQLLRNLTFDCAARDARHPYRSRCAARFVDLDPPRRPPDAPATVLRLVTGR